MHQIFLKRVYDHHAGDTETETDFLVDRLWPRGVSKERLHGVAWAKDVAPSSPLRIWFAHDPERFAEFTKRYRRELDSHPEAQEPLRTALESGPITLLYAAKNPEVNHALVLKSWLEDQTT
ncbi:DUF488 domain-containing protein [Haloglycomyces albus]|uniref:DUF488 domain-containing protein n=1 Tax=Haloglycomyces albus TaxID=526067 RepID=UPI0004A3EA55|nr:DUF488 family protein [Haloglycomyces albus]